MKEAGFKVNFLPPKLSNASFSLSFFYWHDVIPLSTIQITEALSHQGKARTAGGQSEGSEVWGTC